MTLYLHDPYLGTPRAKDAPPIRPTQVVKIFHVESDHGEAPIITLECGHLRVFPRETVEIPEFTYCNQCPPPVSN